MEVFHGSPLKAPAIEIVDLCSEHSINNDDKRDDASSLDADDGEDDDHLSLYEDMLEGMPNQSDWEDGTSVLGKAEIEFLMKDRAGRCMHSRRVFHLSETASDCWRGSIHHRDCRGGNHIS